MGSLLRSSSSPCTTATRPACSPSSGGAPKARGGGRPRRRDLRAGLCGAQALSQPRPGAATAWLYTIARRQLNRYVRRRRVESHWRQRFGHGGLVVAPDALNGPKSSSTRERCVTSGCGARRSQGDIREAVVLRVVDGMSYPRRRALPAAAKPHAPARSRGLKRLARDLAVCATTRETEP